MSKLVCRLKTKYSSIFIVLLLLAFGLFFSFESNPDWTIYRNIYYTGSDSNVDKGDFLFKLLNKLLSNTTLTYEGFRLLILILFSIFISWLLTFTQLNKADCITIFLYFLGFILIRYTIQIREGIGYSFLLFALIKLNSKKTSFKQLSLVAFVTVIAFFFHSGLVFYSLMFFVTWLFYKTKVINLIKTNYFNCFFIVFFVILLNFLTPFLLGKIYLLQTNWQQTPVSLNLERLFFWSINLVFVVYLMAKKFIGNFADNHSAKMTFIIILTNYFAPIVCSWIVLLQITSGPQSLIAALTRLHFLNLALIFFYLIINNQKNSLLVQLGSLFVFIYNIRSVIASLQHQ